MNKKILLAWLVLFPLSPVLPCECTLPIRTFCESIGIDTNDQIGLIEVLSWGGLERDGFNPWNPYIDILVLDSLKGIPNNDTLRVAMSNGSNCATDPFYFWPGKKYVFNLHNYPHWSNRDSLAYRLSACEKNYITYDSDSIYYKDAGTTISMHYSDFKANLQNCYNTQARVELGGRVTFIKDGEDIPNFDFSMNDQQIETDSTGQFETIQLLALERGYTMDSSFFHKENDPLEGVSIRDLVQIQRHVLGIERFPAFWHYVAADVDLSGSVTALDIIHLRRLLKGLTNQLPTKSWVIIPKQEFYSWPTSEQHFRAVGSRSKFLFEIPYDQQYFHPEGYDLWAIKLGDLL